MSLKVYNTASRRKEAFMPMEKGRVKMYVCGITPYDLSHVGHGRSYVAFDVIRRALEYLGYEVIHVQNFTDVDDKIIARAAQEGVEPLELSNRYIEEYFKDLDALGVKRARAYPRVSEQMNSIMSVVSALVEKGFAYEAGGDVYLDVSKKEDYGKLSGQNINDLLAGARVARGEKKRNPLDFALWKKAKAGEISWPSPWGEGRPGWHIECSVMSIGELGPTLDIHGGGQDLIFPHHENEIAQSESYSGEPFARYWLHNGLVTVEGEKMSKSLGNFVTIRELLKRHGAQSIRFFLLSAHYRRPLDFSERALHDAEKGLRRIQNTLFNIKAAYATEDGPGDKSFIKGLLEAKEDFVRALEDDFNVPKALSMLFDVVRAVNTHLEGRPGRNDLEFAQEIITSFTGVLGLRFDDEVEPLIKGLMKIIMDLRSDLRARRDFESSDRLRDTLLELGIIVEDRAQGTSWRFKDL